MIKKFYNRAAQTGQIILFAMVFGAILLALSAALMGYIASFLKTEKYTVAAAGALQLAEAGIDQAAFQLNQNPGYTGETNTPLDNGSFTITVAAIDANSKRITSSGTSSFGGQTTTKTIMAVVAINSSVVSFHYGVQAGDGGFSLANSSSITGNVFSTGPVVGSGGSTSCNSSSGTGNCIYGDIISAGPTGQVYGVHATGTVYSDMIGSASLGTTIDKDAYYNITKIN